jgi:hypothetical protein
MRAFLRAAGLATTVSATAARTAPGPLTGDVGTAGVLTVSGERVPVAGAPACSHGLPPEQAP